MRIPTRARAFTLIELLVVIAIIGVLSSVVLSSLNSARNKASESAVKADLDTIRKQAQLAYENMGGSYNTISSSGNSCMGNGCAAYASLSGQMLSDPVIASALNDIIKLTNAGAYTKITADVRPESYNIAVELPTTPATYWCIDSTGVSRGKNSSGATYTSLTGVTATSASYGGLRCN